MTENKDAGRKEPASPGGRRRRWRRVVGCVLVALVLLFVFLPRLLSTGPGRALLVAVANARMDGSVGVESCSLSWLSGFEFRGVEVRDEAGSRLASIDAVRLSASVPDLLGPTKKLGALEVERPRVTVDLSEAGPAGPTSGGGDVPQEEGPERLPFDLTGTLKVTGGHVSVTEGDAELLAVEDLSVEADVGGLSQPIDYSVRGNLADGGGSFKATGSARVAGDGTLRPGALQGSVQVALERLDLSSLQPLVRRADPTLQVRGLLDADLAAEFEGPREIAATGKLKVSSLALAGGPLRADRPAVASAEVGFDAAVKEGRIELRALTLESPLARARVSGTLPTTLEGLRSDAQLEGSASVELAEVAAQLRNTLRLRPGLAIERGRVLGDFKLSSGEAGFALQAGLQVADLAAVQDGRRITPGAQIGIALKAGLDASGPRVESLTVDSPFATVEGRGTPADFTLSAVADLAAAATEAAKFVDVPADALSGRADLNVRVETVDGERRLTADARLADLRVEVAPERVLREESLLVQAEARTDAGDDVPRAFRDVRAHLESGLGSAHATVGGLVVGEALSATKMTDVSATARLDLARVSELQRALHLGPERIGLAGTVEGSLQGSLAGGVLDLGSMRVALRDLQVRQPDRTLSQDRLELSTGLRTDLAARRVEVSGAEMESAGGRFSIPHLTVPDWRAPLAGATGELSGEADLGRLFADLGSLLPLPVDVTAAGSLSLDASLTPAPGEEPGRRTLSANARLAALNVSNAGGPILEDEHMQLTLNATIAAAREGGAYRLENVSLVTDGRLAPVRLTADGVALASSVEEWAVSGLNLEAEASLGPLARVARQLGVGPADVKVAGHLDLHCSGSLDAGVLEVKDLSAVAGELSLARGEEALREPELRLSAVGRADLAARSARVYRATLDCSLGSGGAADVVIPDWARLPRGVAGNLTASAELVRVLDALHPFAALPEGLQAEGKLESRSAFSVGEDALTADAGISLRPLKLRRGQSPWFTEDSLEIKAVASVPHGRNDIVLELLEISSSPGTLRATASGGLEDWAGARHLTLEGAATPDWARFGALLKALTGLDVELQGAEERSFKLSTRLGEMDWAQVLRQTTADGGVHVRRFRWAGVEAEEMELSVKGEGGRLGWGLTGRVNQGPLTFNPVLRILDDGAAVVLPEPGAVLSAAQITDEAANRLLARALPVFRNPVDVAGTANVTLNEFHVPVAGDLENASIDAVVALRGVSAGSSGLLRSLLGLVGLANETIDVPDQDVHVLLKDGRVHHDRMHLNIHGYTLVSSGSVALDKTLDLLVEVPITRELVKSDSVYDILKGQTIKVPIRGTLDRPEFNRDIIGDNLKSLMRGSTRGLLERLLK